MFTNRGKALTFDDILLIPGYSEVTPDAVDITTWLTPSIPLRIPLLSAAMDTVTESAMAISMARMGGIGIVHKNMPVDRQRLEVERVKKSESGMILDPVTISPRNSVQEALDLMSDFRVSGLPVVDGERLVGILTNRDVRFVEDAQAVRVADVMTSDKLITVPMGTSLAEAKRHLHEHRIEKLLVVDENKRLRGLITMKDIDKVQKYPNACKDANGRLRVGAAIGLAVMVLMGYIQLTIISDEVVSLQNQLEELQTENVTLTAQHEQMFDLATVKEVAEAAGMSKPSSSQIYYIDLSEGDSAVVYQQEESNLLSRLLTSLNHGIYAVVEYFE